MTSRLPWITRRQTVTLGSILLLTLAVSVRTLPGLRATATPDALAIITHPTFANTGTTWSLERLRDWHTVNDTLTAYIITLPTILTNPTFYVTGPWGDGTPTNPYARADEDPITNLAMFNDTQAILRNYLRYAHHDLGVRYVLLVGDEAQIPTRKLTADGYGAPAPATIGTPEAPLATYYDNVPTHLYYASLHGTFNDDEDTNSLTQVRGWGENATHNSDHPIDEVDWTYDLAVGRITPNTVTDLNNIVRKTLTYLETSPTDLRLANIALAGHYLGFGGLAQWGINYAAQLATATCTDWDHVTHGFNATSYTFRYVNADPNRPTGHLAYLDTTVRSVFANGIHIWYQCGHGSTTVWSNAGGYGDAWNTADVATLTNTFYPFVYGALPCLSGRFDDADCLAEAFVNDDHGAFAAIMNARYGWGSYDDLHSVSHYLGREFFDARFSEGYTRLGDMLFDAIQDCAWLRAQSHGAIRWACFNHNLLGDPAATLKLHAAPLQPPLGDVDGDRDVDIYDMVLIASSYGFSRGQPEYNAACDLNQDDTVDIYDVTIASSNYGTSW